MSDSHETSGTPEQKASAAPREGRKSLSMHEDVPIWYDCCSCEAEPQWIAVAEELGIDVCESEKRELEQGAGSGEACD